MDPLQEQFDDPTLRSAIRRAVGKPSAPPRLRESVLAVLATAPSPVAIPRAPSRWRMPELPRLTPQLLAVAAVALIAVGFAGYETYDFIDSMRPHMIAILPPKLSDSVSSSMIAAHDALAKSTANPPAATKDFAALQVRLSKEAGVMAFASSIGQGWDFKGANVTTVDGKKAAEVMFVRGGQAASVFSMPSSGSGCAADQRICQEIRQHSIAAMSRGSTMYAVDVSSVGGPQPTSADAETLLSAVVANLPPATTAPTNGTSH